MFVEWHGVCDFVVFSVVEISVDYGGVYMLHVCFDLCVVYGVMSVLLNVDCFLHLGVVM